MSTLSAKEKSSSSNEFNFVQAKIELKEKADKEYEKNGKPTIDKNEKLRMLSILVSDPNADKEGIEQELNNYGVFLLDAPESVFQIMSDNGDINMTQPLISYDSFDSTWSIAGGGSWNNNNWVNDVSGLWIGYVDETKNMGGKDGFGVGFTSLTGTYQSQVVDQYAYISDGLGNNRETNNRSDGDGSKGFGFELQDFARIHSIDIWSGNYTLSYVGKHFGGCVVYDSSFTYLDGVATSYYIHTYNNAVINSVEFGVSGKSAGINATIENQSSSFSAYSIDTRF